MIMVFNCALVLRFFKKLMIDFLFWQMLPKKSVNLTKPRRPSRNFRVFVNHKSKRYIRQLLKIVTLTYI